MRCVIGCCWFVVVADTDVQDSQVVVLVVPLPFLEPLWPLLHAGGTEGQEDSGVSFCQEREGAEQHFTVTGKVSTTCGWLCLRIVFCTEICTQCVCLCVLCVCCVCVHMSVYVCIYVTV